MSQTPNTPVDQPNPFGQPSTSRPYYIKARRRLNMDSSMKFIVPLKAPQRGHYISNSARPAARVVKRRLSFDGTFVGNKMNIVAGVQPLQKLPESCKVALEVMAVNDTAFDQVIQDFQHKQNMLNANCGMEVLKEERNIFAVSSADLMNEDDTGIDINDVMNTLDKLNI